MVDRPDRRRSSISRRHMVWGGLVLTGAVALAASGIDIPTPAQAPGQVRRRPLNLNELLNTKGPAFLTPDNSGLLSAEVHSVHYSKKTGDLYIGYAPRLENGSSIGVLRLENPDRAVIDQVGLSNGQRIEGTINKFAENTGVIAAAIDRIKGEQPPLGGVAIIDFKTGRGVKYEPGNNSGWPDGAVDQAYTVLPKGNGFLAGTRGEVLEFQAGVWTVQPQLTPGEGTVNNAVHALYRTNNETLVGLVSGGVRVVPHVDPQNFRFMNAEGNPSTLHDNGIRSMDRLLDGRIAVGTAKGISIFNPANGSLIKEALPPELIGLWVRGIKDTPQGRYEARQGGGYVVEGGVWRKIISDVDTLDLAVIPAGVISERQTIVFATNQGLAFVK